MRQRHVAGAGRQVEDAGSRARPSRRPRGTAGARRAASGRARRWPALSSSSRKPMLISLTPKRSSGAMRLAVLADGVPVHAHHRRDRRAVDVGVEQADARAQRLEREGEVDRDGALADAALAAHHQDDVLHAGDRVVAHHLAGRAPRSRRSARPLARRAARGPPRPARGSRRAARSDGLETRAFAYTARPSISISRKRVDVEHRLVEDGIDDALQRLDHGVTGQIRHGKPLSWGLVHKGRAGGRQGRGEHGNDALRRLAVA